MHNVPFLIIINFKVNCLNPDYAIDFVMRATSAIKYEVLRLRHSIAMVKNQNLMKWHILQQL